MDYSKICFVIMPFGKKPVGKREVDFDRIYEEIFQPSIDAVPRWSSSDTHGTT